MMNKKLFNIFIALILLANLIVPIVTYIPVYADTQDRAISSEGTNTDGTYVGGSANLTNLNDWLDTTYLRAGGADMYYYHSYNMQDFTAASETITGVSMTFRISRSVIHNTLIPYVLIGGTKYYGTTQTPSGSPTTYVETTFGGVSNKNPATGANWDATALNNAEFGIRMWGSSVSSWYNYVYDMKITVTYTPQTVPTVTTQAVSDIIYSAAHYALLNGNITSNGGNTTDVRGFVYDTTTHALPGNVAPAASGYSANSSAYSSAIGAYTSNITGMAAGTTYYYRAFAHNGVGWAYGDEDTFTTITSPTVSNMAASNVASSSAQLNSQVTFDGNTTCNITFGLSLSTHSVNFNAYDVFYNVAGTYTTGQFPLYILSSMNASATYYYNVRIQNVYGTAYGTERTFTTTSGVYEPSSITAIPSSDSISVLWVKNGSASTRVMYSTGTYPADVATGTLAYSGTGSSCLITGLDEGTPYYISAWGLTGGVYSTNYSYTMATTTAFTTETPEIVSKPSNPVGWNQDTDSTGINIPIVNSILANINSTYNIPVNTLWYVGWFLWSVILGLIVYNKGNNNLTASVATTMGVLLLGVICGILGFEAIAIVAGIIISIVVLAGRY